MQEKVVSGKKHSENKIPTVTNFENATLNWSVSSSFAFLVFSLLSNSKEIL